jgi:hypothetical protein
MLMGVRRWRGGCWGFWRGSERGLGLRMRSLRIRNATGNCFDRRSFGRYILPPPRAMMTGYFSKTHGGNAKEATSTLLI